MFERSLKREIENRKPNWNIIAENLNGYVIVFCTTAEIVIITGTVMSYEIQVYWFNFMLYHQCSRFKWSNRRKWTPKCSKNILKQKETFWLLCRHTDAIEQWKFFAFSIHLYLRHLQEWFAHQPIDWVVVKMILWWWKKQDRNKQQEESRIVNDSQNEMIFES